MDENGNLTYMQGEEHAPDTSVDDELTAAMSEEYGGTPNHAEIFPIANKISVPFGDIDEYGSATLTGKDFVLQKYISIDGIRYSPTQAVQIIKAQDPNANLSDIYPGTLDYVYFKPRDEKLYDNPSAGLTKEISPEFAQAGQPGTRVVGLKGELGVRLGVSLSLATGGEITNVEVDALDVKTSKMTTLEGNSKLLYCLVKKLRQDEKFRLLTEYIFPLNKATAMWAIYNDYGFLDAIGQRTVDFNDHFSNDPSKKPGAKIFLDSEGQLEGYSHTAGWEAKPSRANPASWPLSWFINDNPWDDWDKELLKNSTARIKKIFKRHYNRRDFGMSGGLGDDFMPGKIILRNLKAAFALPPLSGQMPWWQKRRLVSNPFDANDKICGKPRAARAGM